MSRIGIFGGTFDPVHFGHLRPALELRDVLGLDEVLFVPARSPPHRGDPVASPEARATMVERAIGEVPGFAIERSELEREGPSFTVDTLAALHRERPEAQLVLLLGMDAFLGFAGWREPERVFDYAHIAVTHRPGWSLAEEAAPQAWIRDRLRDGPEALGTEPAGAIVFVEVTQLEISATAVRVTAAAGGDVRYLVPEVVREFIEKTGCYRNA